MAIDVSTKKTLNGTEVVLYSKKQAMVFDGNTKEDTADKKTQIIKQFKDGSIVLHKFFCIDGRWMGYVLIIGPRGGTQALHNFWVYEKDGDMELIVN